MNLQETVSKITGENVTMDEAMAYARDNFDNLVANLRKDLWEVMKEDDLRIKELEEALKHCKDVFISQANRGMYPLELTNNNPNFLGKEGYQFINDVLNSPQIKITTGEKIAQIKNPKIVYENRKH